jgi:hypothetical protein
MTFDAAPGYLSADDCRLADLIDLVSRKTDLADYPYASGVEQNVLIYGGARLRQQLSRPAAVSPALQGMADDGAPPAAIANVIAACAEGYPFPANLDLDQPVDGLAPRTQADILGRAVSEQWSRQQLEFELGTWSARRQTRTYTYSAKEIS